MTINVRKGYKEDYERWDNFLCNSQMNHVLQSSVMSEVWNYISFKPLLIIAEENGNIVGGLMSHIWFGDSKFFPILRIFSTFRSQYGPIIINNENRSLLLRMILKSVIEEAKNQHLMQHIISTYCICEDQIFEYYGYKIIPNSLHYTFIVNFQQSKEKLWKSIARDKRRGIKKALDNDVLIKEGVNDETPSLFYNIHIRTARRLGILPDPYSFIEGIWKILVPKGHAKFLFAYYKEKPIAVLLFLVFNNRLFTYMSGSLEEYHHLYPNNLLTWKMLEYGLENGFESCDLMGSPGPEEKNHPEYGLYIFKSGWGGKMVDIRFYSKIFSPKSLFIWNSFNAVINRFPLFIDFINKKGI